MSRYIVTVRTDLVVGQEFVQLFAAHRLNVFFHSQLFWFFAECTEAQSRRDSRQPRSTKEKEGVTVPLVLDNILPIVNWPGWTNR